MELDLQLQVLDPMENPDWPLSDVIAAGAISLGAGILVGVGIALLVT